MTKAKDYSLLASFGITVLMVIALFAWQGNKGFDLWDEGFLWYGAQRVLLGDVPIRDFMAYDPGRYYWSAALMALVGDGGIMTLRVAVALFQIIGLCAGLFLISRSWKQGGWDCLPYLALSALTLASWMYLRQRAFDVSVSIALIGALAFLIRNPTPRRYFIAGCCVGLAAVFGRNHGVYGAVGSLGVMLWLDIRRVEGVALAKGLPWWAAGVAAGFAPVMLMTLVLPGFAVAFWDSLRLLFEQGATNLPLPIPWPWTIDFAAASVGEAVRGVLVGIFFIATLAFGGLAMAWVLLQRRRGSPVQPALVASAFMSLPYAHYAFSRADVEHLALGIFPLLLGCLVLLADQAAKIKWPLAATLCAVSLWVMHAFHPGWQCRESAGCVKMEVSGATLQVPRGTANDVALIRDLANRFAPNGQSFIVAPYWPSAYALLERRSPMWENFALFPRSAEFQDQEIDRIKAANPRFVLVIDWPLDGRDELRFKNTHPLIHQYIESNYQRLAFPSPAYRIYVPRRAEP